MSRIQLLFVTTLTLLLSTANLIAQEPTAYKIYKADGTPTTYTDMIDDLSNRDVIFFGEQHNCPVAHWLELCVLRSLYQKNGDLTLGMEMFESDTQSVIDEYFSGLISEERFLRESRPWPNYSTDYMPVVDYAREQSIPLIATNVPRRYADVVNKKGLSLLRERATTQALSYMAPLTFEPEPGEEGFFGAMLGMGGQQSDPERVERLQAAQSLKDATMAHFIIRNKRPGVPLLHLNGSYHSVSDKGIVHYLRQSAPTLKIGTIATARQEETDRLDEAYVGISDYVIIIPEDFTRSY